MGVVIFIAYFVLFCWLVTRTSFFVKSGLPKRVLIALFAAKIIAGAAYAWFYSLPQYIAGSDTWRFFDASKPETDFLLKDPIGFIKDIFHYGYNNAGNIFYGQDSYWNDLKSNVVIKLLAVCNVFTFKNYYSNIVLFNFLFFFGPVALYRVMVQLFTGKRFLIVASIFLLPSFIFWCSGIHKDGLIFSALALLIFYFYKQLTAKRLLTVPFIIQLLCLVLIFALRNVVCLLLIPALLTWFLCNRYPQRRLLIVAAVYGSCIILFFASAYLPASINLPQYIIEKQNEFRQLQGGSQIKTQALEPGFVSFIKFLPSALDIALLRPHISEMHNSSYLPAILELFLLWFLTGLFLFSKKILPASNNHIAVIIFCFCFAFSYLLVAGYTITFSGAIVRYKSLVLPILFCPLICITNINKDVILKR
ncbi:MAG TPA: hypothetical protein VG738_04460 [Chitinophagaceae bacterium]|nr:hypothetical protein [Chitinophagaceae bacterium]